jgi:hypothetical protein
VEIMADQLPARSAQSAQDAHEDLLAALAASRELGPEMDSALAERYLEKHGKSGAIPSRGAAPQQQGVVAQGSHFDARALMPVLGVATYIAILVVSGGHLWWTFFLIPMIASSGWWWGEGSHGGMSQAQWQQRYEQRAARHEARNQYRAWRHGYPYYPPSYPPRDDGSQQASTPPATDARTPSDVI